jgi:hypothetical protein
VLRENVSCITDEGAELGMKILAILALVLTLSGVARAQGVENVAQAKADLEHVHADLSGPCGAFRIVQLTAWRLKATGAGLLAKPSGNQCQGFATDIIAYPDGRIYDVLVDGGGANTPAWQADAPVDASRYRPATDPHIDDAPATPDTPPAHALTQADLDRAVASIESHDDLNTQKVQTQIDQVVKNAEQTGKSIWTWLGPILAALGGTTAGVLVH